ncbi:MAG TPA: ABC transporter permease [Eggerthellaceae bacterium]|nr:ABC transporter permease [Eggerthellaceae bacterium]
MKAVDLLAETVSSFRSNKARSLLTILGVVIGISAVIAMTALIGGVKTALVGEMGLSQARLVNAYCDYGRAMNLADVHDMSMALDGYFEVIGPTTSSSASVSSSTKTGDGYANGVLPQHADINGMHLTQGRFFSQGEYDRGSLVVVLDQAGVKHLFGSENAQAVGQTVQIGGADYEVVGVLESASASRSSSTVYLYLPFTTCAQRISGTMDVSGVEALAREDVDVEAAATAIRSWLVDRFRIPEGQMEESLYVVTMKSIMDQLDTLMASFQLLMTAVASISLLVGGIGIMNMMLTNVTERIREIGLRKALGARRRDITRQFLLESIGLTLIGGVFGIVLGLLGALGLSGLAGAALGEGSTMTITPSIGIDSIAMVVGICVLIGVVFGYYPARRAAKLDPVESLRYQ